jgi:hypothetical protein
LACASNSWCSNSCYSKNLGAIKAEVCSSRGVLRTFSASTRFTNRTRSNCGRACALNEVLALSLTCFKRQQTMAKPMSEIGNRRLLAQDAGVERTMMHIHPAGSTNSQCCSDTALPH